MRFEQPVVNALDPACVPGGIEHARGMLARSRSNRLPAFGIVEQLGHGSGDRL
jgi:hypothetical protein